MHTQIGSFTVTRNKVSYFLGSRQMNPKNIKIRPQYYLDVPLPHTVFPGCVYSENLTEIIRHVRPQKERERGPQTPFYSIQFGTPNNGLEITESCSKCLTFWTFLASWTLKWSAQAWRPTASQSASSISLTRRPKEAQEVGLLQNGPIKSGVRCQPPIKLDHVRCLNLS